MLRVKLVDVDYEKYTLCLNIINPILHSERGWYSSVFNVKSLKKEALYFKLTWILDKFIHNNCSKFKEKFPDFEFF